MQPVVEHRDAYAPFSAEKQEWHLSFLTSLRPFLASEISKARSNRSYSIVQGGKTLVGLHISWIAMYDVSKEVPKTRMNTT